jgi:hypothetical protein
MDTALAISFLANLFRIIIFPKFDFKTDFIIMLNVIRLICISLFIAFLSWLALGSCDKYLWVPIFRNMLVAISALSVSLALMLCGIAWLCSKFGILYFVGVSILFLFFAYVMNSLAVFLLCCRGELALSYELIVFFVGAFFVVLWSIGTGHGERMWCACCKSGRLDLDNKVFRISRQAAEVNDRNILRDFAYLGVPLGMLMANSSNLKLSVFLPGILMLLGSILLVWIAWHYFIYILIRILCVNRGWLSITISNET